MNNIYNISIRNQVFKKNIDRLTNQIWKLIPMRENDENWISHLESIILEITGLNNILINVDYLELISKLQGLKDTSVKFEIYRRIVFESISLLRGVKIEEKI